MKYHGFVNREENQMTEFGIRSFPSDFSYEQLAEYYGISKPPGYEARLEDSEYLIRVWKELIQQTAEGLGLKPETYNASFEKRIADHDITIGETIIRAGNVAAVRTKVSGVCGGREAVTAEQILRISETIAADWPAEGERIHVRVTVDTNNMDALKLYRTITEIIREGEQK